MSSLIINNILDIENYTYLELGVNDNINFNQIKCKKKFSVDLNGEGMFTGSTDDYFLQLDDSEKFDIIFIDANHDYDYVLRDFNNSVDHAVRWILMHDMIPTNIKYTQQHLCSDSFKLLYFMLKETKLQIYPMNNNFGLTLIKVPAYKINPPKKYKDVDFYEFVHFMKSIKTYSDKEIIEIINKV